MRKIKLDKETILNANLINDLIEKHAEEKNRIIKMKNYYNGLNEAIMNRAYTDKNKPSNKLVSGYPSYITDNFVGYMVGQPITYKSDNVDLLEKLNLNFLYNDEVDHNTTLAQEQSICGYAYELLYRDEDSNARFTCLETENTIVVYENNLEEKELFIIRLVYTEDNKGLVYAYDNVNEYIYSLENDKVGNLIIQSPHYFMSVPVCTYENNRQRIGDFEKVLSLINAYDLTNSDTANDFEYFTNALLVVSGVVMENEEGQPLNFKDNRVLNFADTNSKAEYLMKNINDSALENYKNRLNRDILRFSNIVDMSDENFASNLSGIAIKFKLQGMENITSIKESKFRKGLMKRIELLVHYLKLKTNTDFTYTEITPVFTRNIPANDSETVSMIKQLYGIVSDETLLAQLPFVENVQDELEAIEEKKSKEAISYDIFSDEEVIDNE